MERTIIETADGSKTIHLPDWNENYHSRHGAVQEALHVFIAAGFIPVLEKQNALTILEVGFGTGLNAILTLSCAQKKMVKIAYHGIEAYPVSRDELVVLGYTHLPQVKPNEDAYWKMHDAPIGELITVSEHFELTKISDKIESFVYPRGEYDLIYFDAFGPRVQPELWTEAIFEKMYAALKDDGVLVTYCAKGDVRRAMLAAGFRVEKIPGPPGKREMLRATAKR